MSWKPSYEVRSVAITRSGIRKLLSIYFELGLCSYWDFFEESWEPVDGGLRLKPWGYWLTDSVPSLERDRLYNFCCPIGFPVGHILQPSFVKSCKIVRLTRDPRDMTISHSNRYRTLCGPEVNFSPTDALDIPLLAGQGSMFGLGPVEEWYLQERYLLGCQRHHPVHFVKYEDLNEQPIRSAGHLFDFIGLEFGGEQLEEACYRSRRETFKTQIYDDAPGGSQKWLKSGYKSIVERASLVFRNGCPHNYLVEKSDGFSSSHWPDDIREIASSLWITKKLSDVRLFLHPAQISALAQSLEELSEIACRIPLVELMLIHSLLANQIYIPHAIDMLNRMLSEGSIFIKISAAMTLYKVSGGDAQFAQIVRNLKNETIKSDYFQSLLRDGCDLIGLTGIEEIWQ